MNTNFDICVIGGGLSGLLAARTLSKKGLKVVLLESQDMVGGRIRPTKSPFGWIGRDLSYIPGSENARRSLEKLNELVDFKFEFEEATLPPVTFGKGHFSPFVGFGDLSPLHVDSLMYYLGEKRFLLNSNYSELIGHLVQNLEGVEVRLNSFIKSWDIQENRVAGAVLEDGSSVKAETFIYSGDIKFLLQSLPTEEYTQKELQKMLKTDSQAMVSLDVLHNHVVTDSSAMHVLMGTTKDSIPALGSFDKPTLVGDQQVQASHWMSFVSQEFQEDDEALANGLREMKRQIKRAFPSALDNVKFEKIAFTESEGPINGLKLDAQGRWIGLENFWVSHEQAHQESGHVGSMCQNELITTAVGQHFYRKGQSSPSVEASL